MPVLSNATEQAEQIGNNSKNNKINIGPGRTKAAREQDVHIKYICTYSKLGNTIKAMAK